jgi:tRNA (adenine-N(1)-)-methyltransferase non-catalytic subunit
MLAEDDSNNRLESTKDDPMLSRNNSIIREGDSMILVFADGRQIFARALKSWKGKSPPVKINKRSYPTYNLLGLPYGTVLELGSSKLMPLPQGEDVVPEYFPSAGSGKAGDEGQTATSESVILENEEASAEDNTFPTVDIQQKSDNRNLVDSNNSQGLACHEIDELRKSGAHGSQIIDKLIENSATFDQKTEFSKAKWIARKQKKHQPRCRIVRCTPFSICEAIFRIKPRNLLNMREDTLGQILSYSNVCAGCQVLVFEQCMGVLTGALAHRLGGYGKVLSVYQGQQPSFVEMLQRFNLSFAEQFSIKWVHSSDIFLANDVAEKISLEADDLEKAEREALQWPCPLQDHTRSYLENIGSISEKQEFLAKRCARFARKLTRHTALESKQWLEKRKCDSIILAVRYDPTCTLLEMLPFLAPSSPFVVFCEFIEPLAECFRELQKQQLAINLRLSDTWMREYQVLPGRTHPNMNMSQSGGYILTGIKLCPKTGKNELDDDLVKEIRAQVGSRRGRKSKAKKGGTETSKNGKKRSNPSAQNGNPAKKAHKEDVYAIDAEGDQIIEIRSPSDNEVSDISALIRASCVCIEPKACNNLLKELAKCLPMETGLNHLKRVQNDDLKREVLSANVTDASATSLKRPKPILKVLLGAANTIFRLQNDIKKPESAAFQSILSRFGPLHNVVVPKYPPQSEEEWKKMNAIWPTQYQPLKTQEFHRQRQALSSAELEIMQQHMLVTMKERAVLIVDPSSNRIVVDSGQERTVQSRDSPEGFIDNCLATPVLLAIQGVSRIERQNQEKDRNDAKVVRDRSDTSTTSQRHQYLCTGYDMYCYYEPNVFEAMSCLHSRLRRLVYYNQGEAADANNGATILQRGCSKYHIHDLAGTNHRYRVFQYYSPS